MYNIHSHYKFVHEFTKQFDMRIQLAYFFPFGSSNFEHLEYIGAFNPDLCLFCYDQEPIIFSNNFDLFYNFNQRINKKKFIEVDTETIFYSKLLKNNIVLAYRDIVNKKTNTILLNTEKDSEEKNKILEHFGYIDCYYFFHGLAAADWYRGYNLYNLTPIKQRVIKKKFICYNRITGNSRIYRLFFVASLFEKNLLDSGYISFSKDCPVHGNLKQSVIWATKNYNLDSKKSQNVLKIYEQLDELRIDSELNDKIENKSFDIGAISESLETFVHVVTETCFWQKKKHLTEKIFKPIVLKQPFLLLGCPNNLAYLREYGFRTFDKWWDESYDTCEDPLERIEMVTNIIKNICNKSNEELQDMLLEMEEVLEHNFNRFYSQEFVTDIWDELANNLKSAIAQLPPQIVPKK